MIDPRERSMFDRIKNLLSEIDGLKADLAELKVEATETEHSAITVERWGDLVAVARLQIMDSAKRAKRDIQRRRRDELEGQISLPFAEAA